ncbi:hypothetical protein RFI_36945 [Reticulomyxa filosa]|uniref:PHD-type domain-containing protein n=1 Tax=Reticulomyxa filosa TaxID=46433 RepID=X6LIG0_RETFI|nr:hypothetical protein RFI_36945 [Reticulomyxa filosa]|eukprot:ETO00495.1 hypothetical protein RFI_36945 [Reticulomyxa filosa]
MTTTTTTTKKKAVAKKTDDEAKNIEEELNTTTEVSEANEDTKKKSDKVATALAQSSIEEKWEWGCCKNDDMVGGSVKCSNDSCPRYWHFECLCKYDSRKYNDKELTRIKIPKEIFICPSCEITSPSEPNPAVTASSSKAKNRSSDIIDLDDLTESEGESTKVLTNSIAVPVKEVYTKFFFFFLRSIPTKQKKKKKLYLFILNCLLLFLLIQNNHWNVNG